MLQSLQQFNAQYGKYRYTARVTGGCVSLPNTQWHKLCLPLQTSFGLCLLLL